MSKRQTGYAKFCRRVHPYLIEPDLRRVMAAYTFSRYGHEGQMRKGGDKFFTHPKTVALMLLRYGVTDWRVLATALLHDVIEDTHLLNEETMGAVFGHAVTRFVKQLTKDPKQGYFGRLKKTLDWQVLLVKMVDRIHNLETVDAFTPEKRARYYAETRRHFYEIADRLLLLLPKNKRKIGEQTKKRLYELCPPL